MIVNFIVILITIVSGLLFLNGKGRDVNSRENRKNYILFVSIILILQSGLRNVAVGADTYTYYLQFERIKHLSWTQIYNTIFKYYYMNIGKDPGYLVFQKIVQYIIPNYQLFLLLIAIFFFSALGNFIFKNTVRLMDALFAFVLYSALFFSFFSITGLRQTIATAATLLGYEFIKKRKLIPFLLLILLASTIHKSVLVFIIFYFIANVKNTKYYYIIAFLVLPVVWFYRNIFNDFLRIAGGYESFVYYEGTGAYTFTFMLLFVASMAWWRLNSLIKRNNQTQHFFNAFILALVFTPLVWVNPSAMRMVQYFSIFMLLLVPQLMYSLRFDSIKWKNIVFILAIVLLILLYIRSQWGIEYKFFWQEMNLGDNYKFKRIYR